MGFDSIEDGQPLDKKTMQTCPDCGTPVEHSEGCIICRGCGFALCG